MGEKKNIIMNLVELGKRNQKVTTKEINDALEEIGFEVELVDKLYEALDANNIEIVDEPDADVEEFTLTEDTVDVLESALSAEGVNIDDPVKGYLKEIGRVPLLSPEEAQRAQTLFKGFGLHLASLAEDYPENVKVKYGGVRNA